MILYRLLAEEPWTADNEPRTNGDYGLEWDLSDVHEVGNRRSWKAICQSREEAHMVSATPDLYIAVHQLLETMPPPKTVGQQIAVQSARAAMRKAQAKQK